jgi:predicted  nucleic acid-binding Zn-ribbon protein
VATEGLRALLEVQERDTEADQLRHRKSHLPERARLDAVVAELAGVEADGATASRERDELARRQAELEVDIGEVDRRTQDIDRQMRSGAVTASRDLQAMADQIDGLKRRKSTLEDSEIEIMEALEPVELRVTTLQDKWAALDAEAAELRVRVAELEAALDAELAAALAARATAVDSVPPELVATYEKLRARLGGVGAASLVGSSCGGCHLTLPAGEIDRIRHLPPDALVTCDQCGRILVR